MTTPRVTEIIRSFAPMRQCDDWYLQRGTAMHHGVKLALEGTLDWSTVDPLIEGKIRAALRFITDCKIQPIILEQRLESKIYGFKGTCDFIGLDVDGFFGIDWKSSLSPHVIPQLGFYHILWKENKQSKWSRACAVELDDNGSYKILWLNKKELEHAERVALAMLTVHGFLQKNKLLPKEQN